jgi:hypothetical protein
MKRVNTLAAGLFLLSQTLCGTAFAASVTLAGNTVDFTFDDTLLGLFGQPGLSGDTLYFTPVDFKSQSLNGAGYALTSNSLGIKLTAHSGWSFSSVDLAEKGDYLLLGTGSQAAVSGQLRAFDAAHPLADVTASIQTGNPLDQIGLATHNWTSQTALDLSAWTAAQTINVTVENILLASTGTASSVAFVEKKFVALTPAMLAVTPVPEADTYAMMLAGLGLVALAGARRRAT